MTTNPAKQRVVLRCRGCSANLRVDADLTGRIRCPKCGAIFEVTAQQTPEVEIKAEPSSESKWHSLLLRNNDPPIPIDVRTISHAFIVLTLDDTHLMDAARRCVAVNCEWKAASSRRTPRSFDDRSGQSGTQR